MDYRYAPSWGDSYRAAQVLVAPDEVPVELEAEIRELLAECFRTQMGRDEFNARFAQVCARYRRKCQMKRAVLWALPLAAGFGIAAMLWRARRCRESVSEQITKAQAEGVVGWQISADDLFRHLNFRDREVLAAVQGRTGEDR